MIAIDCHPADSGHGREACRVIIWIANVEVFIPSALELHAVGDDECVALRVVGIAERVGRESEARLLRHAEAHCGILACRPHQLAGSVEHYLQLGSTGGIIRRAAAGIACTVLGDKIDVAARVIVIGRGRRRLLKLVCPCVDGAVLDAGGEVHVGVVHEEVGLTTDDRLVFATVDGYAAGTVAGETIVAIVIALKNRVRAGLAIDKPHTLSWVSIRPAVWYPSNY